MKETSFCLVLVKTTETCVDRKRLVLVVMKTIDVYTHIQTDTDNDREGFVMEERFWNCIVEVDNCIIDS